MQNVTCYRKTHTPSMTHEQLVDKAFLENIGLINSHIKTSRFPLTFTILLNFNSKFIGFEKAIGALKTIDTFYVNQGLTRLMLEHYLVSFYIWIMARINDNDQCAYDYQYYYLIFEKLKQSNYNSKLDKSYDSTRKPLDNFLNIFPQYQGKIDEDGLRDLNTRANKFDVRKILKFMQDELTYTDFYKDHEQLVHSACIAYNNLSSFVHGGRFADFQTFENLSLVNKLERIDENNLFSKFFLREIKSWIFLLLCIEDRKFLKVYQPVTDFLRNQII